MNKFWGFVIKVLDRMSNTFPTNTLHAWDEIPKELNREKTDKDRLIAISSYLSGIVLRENLNLGKAEMLAISRIVLHANRIIDRDAEEKA